MLINWDEVSGLTGTLAIRLPLIFLIILMILLLRRVLTQVVMRPLIRLLTRGSADVTTVEGALRRVLGAPINYLLVALILDLTARIFEAQPPLIGLIFNFTRTLVIVAALVLIVRLINLITVSRGGLFRFTGLLIEESLLPFARTGLQLIVVVIGLAIVIGVWGYDVSGLIAGLGIGGLAISLAAQDTLSNLFGFTALVSDRPFVVGDYIKTPDVEGAVEHVGLRSTRVRQNDQALVSIPNSKLANSAVLNWSRLTKRWINLTLALHYHTTADKLEALLAEIRELLRSRESVDPDSVVVYLINLSPQSIEILVRCYVRIPDWTAFTAEKEIILLRLMRIIEENQVQLALPLQSFPIAPSYPVISGDDGQIAPSPRRLPPRRVKSTTMRGLSSRRKSSP